MKPLITTNQRPRPETMNRSRNQQTMTGSLAIAASQIAKGIRSVSWGFEEIYEDTNPHFDQSDQDTSNSEGTFSLSQKAQPSPEDRHNTKPRSLLSNDALRTTGEEADLLSRTLELSKGLLETIMGSQVIMDHKEPGGAKYTRSGDSREKQYERNNRNQQPTPTESRDDFHYQEKRKIASNLTETTESDLSPMIQSRLETLRMQRSQALTRFRLSQMPTTRQGGSLPRSKRTEPDKRDRDRLKYYTFSHEYGKNPSINMDHARSSGYEQAMREHSFSDDSDIELKYTTSDSNASTPSQKARDLRMQLDEAMKASKEIQMSQDQLGSELNTFKQRYYKNSGIEDYALKAIGGGP